MSKKFFANTEEIFEEQIKGVEFGKVLTGSNSYYELRPSLAFGVSGMPYTTYGIYNVETGVMETESRQLGAAKEYVSALTSILKGEPVMTSMVRPMSDEEEEELQQLPLTYQ